MSDPSFSDGVDTESVIEMVKDIGNVFLGNCNYISARSLLIELDSHCIQR
jgi:hypothetical protein